MGGRDDESIPVKLTHDMCWFLREKISPGQFLHPQMEYPFEVSSRLRKKINSALLQFAKNNALEEVELLLTPEEAWCIDLWVRFDGPGNRGTSLLYQVFEGLKVDDEPEAKVLKDVRELLGEEDPPANLDETAT